MSRILFLTHRFPFPPNRGDRIRAYNLLKSLSQLHRVTLASVSDEDILPEHLGHIKSMCEEVHTQKVQKPRMLFRAAKSIVESKALTEGMLFNKTLAKKILDGHRKNSFDLVLVFCSGMFPYVSQPEFENVRVIVDLVDVDSQKWLQMSRESQALKTLLYYREFEKVKALEQTIARRSTAITLTSDDEAKLFRQTVFVPDTTEIRVVGNGVDTHYFDPAECVPLRLGHNTQTLAITFTGVMNYYPNVSGVIWFCRNVLPRLQQHLDVSFKIVGRNPNARVRALAKLDGVEVTGEVTDVRPYLIETDIAVAPLTLARGVQNKVLEAMAMKRPVVCSSAAAEGIEGINGTHFFIADSADHWLEQIVQLASNPRIRESVGAAARKQVVQQHSWQARLKPMMELMVNPSLEPSFV